VVPHHSADDSPRSRLSRSGTRLTLQHAGRMLVEGVDWNPGGVMERMLDAAPLDATEAEVLSSAPSDTGRAGWAIPGRYADAPALWHPHAAWIKPPQLVAQWLAHPRIRFVGGAPVHHLSRADGQWNLCNAKGDILSRADTVVFANAHGCVEVLQRLIRNDISGVPLLSGLQDKLAAMQTLHGTLSSGPQPSPGVTAQASAAKDTAFPAHPVNGHGSLISQVPTSQGLRWFAGSTFHHDAALHADLAGEHRINRNKLQTLLPEFERAVATQFERGEVSAWQATRCVTHDRLPLVGPLTDEPCPTLWMSAGMGARGLSFSALCAELLVAEMHGEPWPVESKLRKALSSRRLLRNAGKRQDDAQ